MDYGESMSIDLSIIIVGLNIKEYLLSCVKSIFSNPPSFSYEIIYVDNGSTDGSVKMIKKFSELISSKEKELQPVALIHERSAIKFILNKKNLGFTKANNQGTRIARGKYLLFLNSDTEVVNGALGKMVRFLEEHPETGVVGPKLFNSKKMDLQVTSTGALSPLTAIFALSFINKYFPNNYFSRKYFFSGWDRNSIKEVDAVSGAALMIRTDLFKKIGGFDERYFIYFEETDLCLAVKKEGKRVIYLPQAGIIHYGGKTTKKISSEMKRMFKQSRYRFIKKHYGFLTALITEGTLRFFEGLSRNEKE